MTEIKHEDIARFRMQAQTDLLECRATTIDPQDLCALLDEICECRKQLTAIAKPSEAGQ